LYVDENDVLVMELVKNWSNKTSTEQIYGQ